MSELFDQCIGTLNEANQRLRGMLVEAAGSADCNDLARIVACSKELEALVERASAPRTRLSVAKAAKSDERVDVARRVYENNRNTRERSEAWARETGQSMSTMYNLLRKAQPAEVTGSVEKHN